jgi:serine protease
VELTDKEAGVTSAEVRFKSPTAGQIANAYFTASELISGDVYNGVYETTLTIPRYAEQGTWTVEFAYLRDQVNNNVWLQTADLQNLGFPTTFSQLGVGDRCAPYLESLSFTPNQVAASAASQTVMVAARLSDRPAGVASGEVRFKSPTGGQIAGVYFGPAERISGDAYSGDYQAAMTIPQLAEQGTWLIEFAYLRDQAGSSIWLSTADLQGSGFPAALTVT